MNDSEIFDLVVVGGGINGTGIARDASGRGLRVLLCEQDDLAQHTSSASTKLIHGGLRYLEYYKFGMVRKALKERDVLLRAAPHIIWPMRFVMPHVPKLRPSWLIQIGLFLYDHLGGHTRLMRSQRIDLRRHESGRLLDPAFTHGYAYSDCWVQDSRLVVLNALDAAERGADVRLRTRCVDAQRRGNLWRARLRSLVDGSEESISAHCIVNATGPWVSTFRDALIAQPAGEKRSSVRLIKGSHIVVRKLYDHPNAYLLQSSDGRVVFVIPYEHDYTLIGTTEESFTGDPAQVAINSDEVAYLCKTAKEFLRANVQPSDVIWSFSGVRPLYDDSNQSASAVTREYSLELDGGAEHPPLLSVFGGKITTYRTLSEEAVEMLRKAQGWSARPWTRTAKLPGGDLPHDFDTWIDELEARHPFLPRTLLWRYARNYGTRVEALLGGARSLDELGQHFGDAIYEAELKYLQCQEWAQSAEDVLWRRSRMGLHVAAETVHAVEAWFGRSAPQKPQVTGLL